MGYNETFEAHDVMEPPPKINRRLVLLIIGIVLLAGGLFVTACTGANKGQTPTALPAGNLNPNEALLAFAQCMRENGVTEFPDPKDGGINLLGTGVDLNSPVTKAARKVCESLLPQSSDGVPDEKFVPGDSAWEKVVPGGDTRCADGSEFVFWVRPADPDKVVLFLEGGGACWDAEMCAFIDESTMYDWNVTGGDDPVFKNGIFDLSNPDNPFAGYSFVYVPYCTGDVHLGDITREYSPDLKVEHNGFVNGATALANLTETYPDAGQVVVIGLSAGSVAAPVYAGLVSDALPDAQITVLADSSGAYPDDPDLNAEILGMWDAYETMPDWEVNEGLTAQDWGFNRFWIQAGSHDPAITMARFDHAFDAVQAKRLIMTGLDTTNLLATIDSNEAAIEDAGVVQHSYTAPGSDHGILNREEFYTMEVNGVTLVDWIEALVAGEPLDDVHCDECGSS